MHLFRGNVYNSSSDSGAGRKVSDSDRARYNSELKRILETKYGDYVVEFSPNLTVEKARKKIVIFTRDRISFVHLDKQARITNWDTEFPDSSNPAKITNELDTRLATNLHVQDISEGNDDVRNKKLEHCKNLINFAQTQKTPAEGMAQDGKYVSEWVMNFTSIENSGSSLPTDNTNGYKGGASVMNPEIRKYIDDNLGRGPLGVFFSDYVLRTSTKKHNSNDRYDTIEGDKLVYSIIANNFTGGENAPVVRYALDDNHDWTAMPTRYFLRNVGASRDMGKDMYYGAGSIWGTRCTLDEAGLAVNLNLDSNGHYHIKSNLGELYYSDKERQFFCDGGSGIGFILSNTTYNGKPVYIFTETNSNYLSAFKFDGEASNDYDKTKAYGDRPDYFVFAREPSAVKDETYHMWELVAEDDRIAELEREAKLVKPYNATFMVPAYGFAGGSNGGAEIINNMWQYTKGSKANVGQATQPEGGALFRCYNDAKRFLETWTADDANWSFEGKITGLPNGIYDFYCQARADHCNVTATIAGQDFVLPRSAEDGNSSENVASAWFAASADNGKILKERFEVTDGTISMRFVKTTPTSSASSFFLDNIHLTYYGHAQDVNITFPEHWNTVILPFDVTDTDLTAVKGGDDIHFYQATGLTTTGKVLQENLGELYEYHLVNRSDDINSLKANTPYIVENNAITEVVPEVTTKKAPARRAASTDAEKAAASKVYTFTGFPIDTEATYTDQNNILTGVLTDGYEIGEGHYALQTTNFQLFGKLESGDVTSVEKYRAFVHADSPHPTHPMILFNDVENVLTGVEDVAAEEQGITDETPVDVYTTGGVMLRHGVAKGEALNDLPRGLYILTAGSQALKVAK